jgi:hypothetical protein
MILAGTRHQTSIRNVRTEDLPALVTAVAGLLDATDVTILLVDYAQQYLTPLPVRPHRQR